MSCSQKADANLAVRSMAARLESRLGRWQPSGGTAEFSEFNRLAMEVHAFQRAFNPVLRRFWEDAGACKPSCWQDIPPVPASAFKDVALGIGNPEAVFFTTGTTAGRERRGQHQVASLTLYKAAARANYRHHLLRGLESLRVVSLIPDPAVVRDSSLACMAGFISDEPEVLATTWAYCPRRGVDLGAVQNAVAGSDGPVLVLATAFALAQLLECVSKSGRALRLPPGSRIMETGGFKGRTVAVSRARLCGQIRDVLGVPESRVISEYGMTELLSQAYAVQASDAGDPRPAPPRVYRFPPWVRTRALDPESLAPLPTGKLGLLAHFDLANVSSVCHILTEDLGETTGDGGFRLRGRTTGTGLRGCSLMAESFLEAVLPNRGSGARARVPGLS